MHKNDKFMFNNCIDSFMFVCIIFYISFLFVCNTFFHFERNAPILTGRVFSTFCPQPT